MTDSSFESGLPRELNWGTYSELRVLSQKMQQYDMNDKTQLRITLAGNCNMDFLIPAMTVNLLSEGIQPIFSTSAYNNWIPETFGNDLKVDIWIIWLSVIGSSRGFTRQIEIDLEEVVSACERIAKNGSKVVLIPPEPGNFEFEPFSEDYKVRTSLVNRLQERLSEIVTFLSIEHLISQMGSVRWHAPRYWEQAKIPCHPDAVSRVGTEIAVTISRLIRPRVKAVVVDLDDTLWGGLLGEVGPEGINTDPTGSGRPYLELQMYLKHLTARGIALSVVSKNDPDQAMRPFKENPEMVLRMEDFVHFEASWNPKYESILKIQNSLKIGIDSICFIDDSIQERNEARGLLPGLIVPEIPNTPSERVNYLLETRLFTNPKISFEDQIRSEFYRREKFPSGGNLEQYLIDLDMSITPFKIGKTNFDRVFSLLHKTNQFNTSLWRPNINELQDLVENKSNYSFCFKLSDRLGDAGITSVLLAERNSDEIRIRSWVVSCRVFSRGFEWAILSHLASWARNKGVQYIATDYQAGPRNGMIKGILESIGIPLLPNMPHAEPVPIADLIIPHHVIKISS